MKKMRWRKNRYNIFPGGKHHAEKYNNNPLHRLLIIGFMDAIYEMVQKTGKRSIFEIGCGEGQILGVLHDNGYDVGGMDIDEEAVQMANDNFASTSLAGGVKIIRGDLYNLREMREPINGKMLICCEVLEHVSDLQKGLQLIAQCTDEYFIVSVPHEPIWRVLNIVRGKYWKHFGNTPGHINHWTKRQFIQSVSEYAEIIDVQTPLPWTIILAKSKKEFQ